MAVDQVGTAAHGTVSPTRCLAFARRDKKYLCKRSTEHDISPSDFSRDLENPSPNLSPARREALTFPPSLAGKGARGLGFALAFPHNVKSQSSPSLRRSEKSERRLLAI
jgi:hypothetical protein